MTEFEELSPQIKVTIFTYLSSEDQMYARGTSKSWFDLIPLTSVDLEIDDEGTLATIQFIPGSGVEKFIDDEADEDDTLHAMPDRFWPVVTSVSLSGGLTRTGNEIPLLADKCTNIEAMEIIEPAEEVCRMLEKIFTNNGSTLSSLRYQDSWCGIEDTDFDFGWLAKCPALRQVSLNSRNNRVKRMELMPHGITDFVTTSLTPMETLIWMSENLKNLSTLVTGVHELLEQEDNEGPEGPTTFDALVELGNNLPMLQTVVLIIHSKGLSHFEWLDYQLGDLQNLCETAPGVDYAFIHFPEFVAALRVRNMAHYIFACQIDRDTFTGFK